MLLSGALFALFMTGCWLYCLTDALLTPAAEYRGLAKPAWVALIAVTFIGGAIAWLIVRPTSARRPTLVRPPARRPTLVRPPARRPIPSEPARGLDDEAGLAGGRWTAEDDAVARHPAGRARMPGAVPTVPKGPDDDAAFLRVLDRVIRGNFQAGEEV
jgi:hypothetical protein